LPTIGVPLIVTIISQRFWAAGGEE
jgi:hypothetical protein